MDLAFHPLLKIQLQHDYFTDGNCPEVDIVPSAATARLLQRMEIHVVKRDSGVDLFYGERNSRPTPLAELAETIRLSFWLRPTNPLFYNYTDHFPQDGPGHIFYATNFARSASEEGVFSPKPEAMFPLETARFQRQISTTLEAIDITDENGDSLGEDLIYKPPVRATQDSPWEGAANDKPAHVNVLTNNLQAGKYFYRDGEEETAFVAGVDGYLPGDIGLFCLYLGDTGRGERAVINADGSIEPAVFTASFTARATKWRYHLIASTAGVHDFSISGDGGATEFLVPEEATRTLPNGTKASILISSNHLQLRANPTQRFKLSFTDESGRAHNDAMVLPNANAESLSRDGPTATELCSDIYVYV